MKRLTFDGNFCDISQCRELQCPYDGNCSKKQVWERLKAYEDSGCEPEEVLPKDKADEIALKLMRLADLESLCSYDHLRELAAADKDGRVVVLPCAPDAICWKVIDGTPTISCFGGLHVYEDGTIKYAGLGEEICAEDIGKSVFLTYKEAEKALREMAGK